MILTNITRFFLLAMIIAYVQSSSVLAQDTGYSPNANVKQATVSQTGLEADDKDNGGPRSDSAGETTATESEADPAPPATFDGRIAAHILETLENAAGGRNDREKQEWESLKNFYQAANRTPLWIDEDGLTKRGQDVMAEIRKAGDWGLVADHFKLPSFKTGDAPSENALGDAELQISKAVLKYALQAKGGRADPAKAGRQMQDLPELPEPTSFLDAIASSFDPAGYLRSLHPKHRQFVLLREKLLKLRKTGKGHSETEIPPGPVLKRGVKHEHVALLRKRLNISPISKDRNQFDEKLEEAVKKFQRENGLAADGVVGSGTRKQLNGDTNEKAITKILINMERWRWLRDDLSEGTGIYVWTNIPEFRVRVVKNDKVAFNEKAIVGEVRNQTPVFSDQMEWIEFHPTWYVPDSIKVTDILPSLRRSTSTVMERYNLRMDCGRLGRNHKTIDWSKVDIRRCSFTQPPGSKSVLGDFKFKFPNKHSVYMHDTHKPGLFKGTTRTYSHGCVRVKNPRRMAEILLDHDKGMSADRIGEILDGPRTLHKEELNKAVPVHMTYFTALFDEDGNFISRPDYYGHDRRLAQAMTGQGHLFSTPRTAARKRRAKSRPKKEAQNFWDNFLQN